jgi:hypothetical protein
MALSMFKRKLGKESRNSVMLTLHVQYAQNQILSSFKKGIRGILLTME